MRHTARSAFKGIKLGQPAESWRSSSEPHGLSAAWATLRHGRRFVSGFLTHDLSSTLKPMLRCGADWRAAAQPLSRRRKSFSNRTRRPRSKTSGAALDGYLEAIALLRRDRRINVRQSTVGPAKASRCISAVIDPESDIGNRRQARDPFVFESGKRACKREDVLACATFYSQSLAGGAADEAT